MTRGQQNQLTKQAGEFRVAAELCRRGYIATTFTGNVPHYDILALDIQGNALPVQVKTVTKRKWQFDVRTFIGVTLEGKAQVIGISREAPVYGLIFVFVELGTPPDSGDVDPVDRFYVLPWNDLCDIAVTHHKNYLAKHDGVRPKRFDSFHAAIDLNVLEPYRNRWDLLRGTLPAQ